MTSEERQQQINTLVERLRELDLKKRAMVFSCRVFENIHTGRN